MKLAFCLLKYFPYGGLQRDFMRIAKECVRRGHEVHVLTAHWDGPTEPHFHLEMIKMRGFTNHHRAKSFAKSLRKKLQDGKFDVVIGFNKLPNLDVYYAADVCYQARVNRDHHPIYKLLPRYREWVTLENEVFAKGKKTEILLISPFQKDEYESFYQTEFARLHILPPGIAEDRVAPSNANEIRARVRSTENISENDFLLLMVGSSFKTKGVDRSIQAVAALPDEIRNRTHLFVIGVDKPTVYLQLAKEFGIEKQLRFLGGRDDVPAYLLAADILLHPSHHENTGTVILEAIASGLPVLTVDVCGYAHYVKEAKAGFVLDSPYEQKLFNFLLEKMLSSDERAMWRENGIQFAKTNDLYSMPIKASDIIEAVGHRHVLS